jgi:hypothetical protein
MSVKLHMDSVAPSPSQAARKALRAAGVTVHEIARIFPPYDTGGELEVWFVGRTRGQRYATRQTAYLRDSKDADEPTIAVGW